MKTAESKTSSSAQSKQGNKPFFAKEGDSFFEKPVQAKLSVGQPSDRYEKEADSVADKVVRRKAAGDVSQTITPLVQQKCKHCEEEEKEKKEDKENVQCKPIFESDAEPIQRVPCRECEEGNKVLMKPLPGIQRAEEDQTPKNDGSRASILAAAQGELGKVHARTNDGTGRRVGADRLNEYFKIAAPDVWDESIITTAGVEMPSWCGIFSVWAHKKAGKNLGNWQMGKGVSAFGTLTNTTTPQPGDIGYIHKQNQHHAIVKEIKGDNVTTIDGNSGVTSEVKENTKPRSAYTLFMTAFGGGGGADVQKKEEEHLQSKGDGEPATASSSVENRIGQSKGTGSTLPEDTKKGMEQSFGTDFSGVRIHTGSDAAGLSKDLRAQAFTHGNDIYFNSGKYDPDSDTGKHLLAHELTHVIQQNGSGKNAVQNKDETTLCDEGGKNRPKSKPSASSILLEKYTHLAKVIPAKELDMIQKALDAQYKISELKEKQKPYKDKLYPDQSPGGYGGDSAMVAKYKFYQDQINQQSAIVVPNSSFTIDSKLLAADDIKRPDNEDNEAILAFHEQLYKRFTEIPVLVTIDPCQVTENSQFNIFLKYGWRPVPQTLPWPLVHTKGLVTFKNLMTIQKWNIDYQKVVIGQMVKILERMVELRREMGDTYEVQDQKLGYIKRPFFDDDITLGYKMGNLGGYPDDGRGRMAMYAVLNDAANASTARIVLKSPAGWLHIYRVNHNFDTLEMTSPDNDGNLLIIDRRANGIKVYDDQFFTKDGRQLKEAKSWWFGPVWSTPRELSELEEFAIGAILGDAFESNSGSATFGQIVIGLIPIVGQIADARDVCVGIHKMWETGGKDGKMQTAFAMIGFVPLFGDWIKRAAKIGKNAPDVAKVAAKTDAVNKGVKEMGDGVSHTSAKKIENATEKGAGKKGAEEALEALPEVKKPFVKQVMQEAGKATEESASAIAKTGNAATDAASAAHGRPLSDLANPKVLAESTFKVGEAVHTVKVVEIGNMKQIWLCTTCGHLIGKIDDVLEGAKGPAVEKLRKIREAAADLERKVTNGEVKPHDVDGQVRGLAKQMNDLARQNPDMAGLTKFMREDLERQYKLLNNVDDVNKLSDGAKEALRRNYEHPPHGYFWRLDGQNLEVVRKSDGVARPKLVYDVKTHSFILDAGATTAARFGDIKAVDAFIELGGRDANKDFGKFVKTVLEELGVTEKKLIDDLTLQNPKGFKDAVQDSVRHKLKSSYIDNLFTLITDANELSKKAVFKEVLAKTGNINEALRAASHEELIRIGKKLGASDKGSLGERWFKGWFADRGETVAKQVTLGPEHGIKHAASRRVDIFEDHLAREMKNVTTHVGTEGANQLEDLVSGIGKKVMVDGAATGYDSVRWVFLDPIGGSANAGWMVEQLGKYPNTNVSFQVLNNKGKPLLLRPEDLSTLGADKLKQKILDWTKVDPKLAGESSQLPKERAADAMADKVVQQLNGAKGTVQKDDDEGNTGDPAPKTLYDALDDYYSAHQDMVDDIADNEEKAAMRRMLLLIELQMDASESQTTTFTSDKERDDTVQSILETLEEQAKDERTVMDILISERQLGVTPETFLDSQFFLNNISAFPKAFWAIVQPLIAVQPERIADAESAAREAYRMYNEASAGLSAHLLEYGLPVSYGRSLQLSQYELIKSANFNERLVGMAFYKQKPTWASDLDFLITPEETNLHSGTLQLYQMAWTTYVVKKFEETGYRKWLGSYMNLHNEVMSGNIPPVNAQSLKAFKEKNPQGLESLENLMRLGGGSAVGDLALTFMAMQTGFDPEMFMLHVKSQAINAAATEASSFIGGEIKRFSSHLYTAGTGLQALEPNERLRKAIGWSFDKGFAKQSIEVLIDNFDDIVIDMLEEIAEESILKRVISFIASLHPIGRVIAIAYTIYQTSKEVKEAIDTVEAIQQVVGIIDDARNSTSIVQTQKASAQLAFASIELIPIIIEKLSSALAKKLKKGSGKAPDADTATATPTHTKTPDTSATGTTTAKSTTDAKQDVDIPDKLPDKTSSADKPATPDTPDKNTTSTNAKVHADPPKPVHQSNFKMDGELHTTRVVEMGGRKQIWVCSTCGNLVGKLDEAIAQADGDTKKQLQRYRDSAASLEDKINSKHVDQADIDKKVMRIYFEINKIAKKDPSITSLNKIVKEDLERQFMVAYNVTSIDGLTPAAKEALSLGYRPTPPGYHWRKNDNNRLEVVRNADGEVKSKLNYNPKENRFEIDPETPAPTKRFDKGTSAEKAFEDLGAKDPNSDFGKFIKTTADALQMKPEDLFEDFKKKNPKGFDGKTHDNVRHKFKEEYVDKLFEKTKNKAELEKSDAYKNALVKYKGNTDKALQAASHAKMIELSQGMGASDKGSLGERWFKENFAHRGEDVATQAVLGPEHGITHKDKRKVDIYEDHLAREVKNVTGSLGQEGSDQIDDLLAGAGKELTVNGKKTGYDSVRLVFLDPMGGAANASWMIDQLKKHKGQNLSFQVMNKHGVPMDVNPSKLLEHGDKLQEKILEWAGIQKKSIGTEDNNIHEQVANRMAARVIARKTQPFFGAERNSRVPFFNKYE